MPDCIVHRSHRFGRPLREEDWPTIPGPVSMYSLYREDMRRYVRCFRVVRTQHGERLPPPIPDLMDVELLTFTTDRALMVRGFEEIDGARYYQGWYITWKLP